MEDDFPEGLERAQKAHVICLTETFLVWANCVPCLNLHTIPRPSDLRLWALTQTRDRVYARALGRIDPVWIDQDRDFENASFRPLSRPPSDRNSFVLVLYKGPNSSIGLRERVEERQRSKEERNVKR
ncbi:hypothetical protein Ddc_12538 [Ditylenchus destructor]|nr:hypothetical protein Ddc_12538 [Ditylenchus destructor]